MMLALFLSLAAPPQVSRFALIVANNKNADPAGADLRYADDDGALYFQLFSSSMQRVELLSVLDDRTQRRFPGLAALTHEPSTRNLHAALDSLFADMRAARSLGHEVELTFVFVGHGGVDAHAHGYVHLSDGHFSRESLFHDVLAAAPADTVHVVIDACHALALVAGRGSGETATPFADFLAGHDLASYPNVGVLVATSDDRETHEWSRIEAGVFSHLVRAALSGAADLNLDGRIEYSEVAAFVDAAASELSNKRFTTFAWAPQRDRHAPLFVANEATHRRIVLGPQLSGHLFVEDASGVRIAEFNKADGQAMVLSVAKDSDYFLRDALRERELKAGSETLIVSDGPRTPYQIGQRGAVDQAFATELFANPLTRAYYRGFVSAKPEMIAVAFDDRRERLATAATAKLSVGSGYVGGETLIVGHRLDSGAYIAGDWRVLPALSVSVQLELGYSNIDTQRGLTRFGVIPSVWFHQPLMSRLALHTGVGAGYSVVTVSGPQPSTDASVFMSRLALGVQAQLWRMLWMRLDGAAALYVVRVDNHSQAEIRPEVLLGLVWQGWQ